MPVIRFIDKRLADVEAEDIDLGAWRSDNLALDVDEGMDEVDNEALDSDAEPSIDVLGLDLNETDGKQSYLLPMLPYVYGMF